MGSVTQHPPRAIDLHVVFGAGAYWDPGLQHEEHIETHFHILFGGNLQKEAQCQWDVAFWSKEKGIVSQKEECAWGEDRK